MRRDVPLWSNPASRAVLGLALAVLSPWLAAALSGAPAVAPFGGAMLLVAAWAPAVLLTDKYRHKYPQRYDTYLLASHLKAAVVMLVALIALRLFLLHVAGSPTRLGRAFLVFIALDYLAALPRRHAAPPGDSPLAGRPAAAPSVASAAATAAPPAPDAIDTAAALASIGAAIPAANLAFLRAHLPEARGPAREAVVINDVDEPFAASRARDAGLLVVRTRLNDVRRLNLLLGYCAEHVAMQGFIAVRYVPLEETEAELKRRYPGLLYRPAYVAHFIRKRLLPKTPFIERWYFSPKLAWLDGLVWKATKRRGRVLPKAEVWGRLAFWGFDVVAEEEAGVERIVLARRASPPPANRRPSFFSVVGLEKVGLDGKLMRTHKVRSMYPFSEFLQKKLYDSHGLTQTGKFKNDFRLTEYGKWIRRHWIDELPGVYDWLHGEIKLVGMRATSAQFLSTYPRELYDLYIQIKPGLIPPIFDESTGGFEAIVKTELTYLKRYAAAPFRTDVAYFWYTFRDIVFRSVRSH